MISRKGAKRTLAIVQLVPAVRELWQSPDLERLYEWDEALQSYRLRRPDV